MRTICYYPHLVQRTGSINAALMMAQLEFWFKVMAGKSFYKFLEPCHHELYKVGDSWSEELGMTSAELRSAFKRIGTMYKSKSAFLQTEDVFQGKPYAAYYDRMRKTTYYFRNDEKVQEMMSTSLLSITQENEDGLYREDNRKDNIINSIEEGLEEPSLKTYSVCEKDTAKNQDDSREFIPFEEIKNLYNDKLGEQLGYVSVLTSFNKKSMKRLVQVEGMSLKDFEQAFSKVAASRFLCGQVEGKKWCASFKWLVAEDHLLKVLTGVYDDFLVQSSQSQTYSDKVRFFNQMESHHFDFEEIEKLERLYIDQKLREQSRSYQEAI